MEKLLMNVKLVSHTIACDDFDFIATPTELVAFCARVSNPNNQTNTDTSEKLINYLIKWKHWSPFEMVNVCLEIETTRDIARQILRHRSFTFQEFSQRYADPVKELTFETREARLQDQKNRQNSIETDDKHLYFQWRNKQELVIAEAKNAYQWAIDKGIAKEVARAVLPEGLTTSRMYVNGTLRSWIHYIETRTHVSTQKEHREIAQACAEAIAVIFPLINNFSQTENTDAK
jgi:thymidylate synthase (FAD)